MNKVENIRLTEMTAEQMQSFFKGFTYDSDTFADITQCVPYIYDPQAVDAYYNKHKQQGKLHFAIMLDNDVIGDMYLKQMDCVKKSCAFGIHLINDSVKNKGYGTIAEELLLSHLFNELKMEKVLADCLIKNQRSQHVLKKVGFTEIMRDKTYVYFECDRNVWSAQKQV